MIEFVSLSTIVNDLLSIIRGAKVTQSEPISKRQLESWVHQYRALLLKRDLDKGKTPNPDYIQEIVGLKLSSVDEVEGLTGVARGLYILRSDLQLPKTIDLNFKPGIIHVGTTDGHEIPLISEGRSKWQQYRKYTGTNPVAFLRNEYLYIVPGNAGITWVDVRGIFEVPTEVGNFVNPTTTQGTAGMNDPYPIPINVIPVLKELILKNELGVQIQVPSDTKNDSSPDVSQNIAK